MKKYFLQLCLRNIQFLSSLFFFFFFHVNRIYVWQFYYWVTYILARQSWIIFLIRIKVLIIIDDKIFKCITEIWSELLNYWISYYNSFLSLFFSRFYICFYFCTASGNICRHTSGTLHLKSLPAIMLIEISQQYSQQ